MTYLTEKNFGERLLFGERRRNYSSKRVHNQVGVWAMEIERERAFTFGVLRLLFERKIKKIYIY